MTGRWTSGQRVKGGSRRTTFLWAKLPKVSPGVQPRCSLAPQWWCPAACLLEALVRPHVEPVSSVHVGRPRMHLSSIYDPRVKVQWCTISLLNQCSLGLLHIHGGGEGGQEYILCVSFDIFFVTSGNLVVASGSSLEGYKRLRVLPVFHVVCMGPGFLSSAPPPPLSSSHRWAWICCLESYTVLIPSNVSWVACFFLSRRLTLPFRPTGLFCSHIANLYMYWGEVPDAFCARAPH